MNMHQIIASGIFAAALLPSFGAGAAPLPVADTELRPVEVEAPPIRHDVLRACPAMQQELLRTLAPAWARIGAADTMKIDFRVENRRVTQVAAVGSVMDYRPYVRRAVRQLDCDGGSAVAQDFRFLLVIRDSEDAPTPERFASITVE